MHARMLTARPIPPAVPVSTRRGAGVKLRDEAGGDHTQAAQQQQLEAHVHSEAFAQHEAVARALGQVLGARTLLGPYCACVRPL
jgi:hypothetical protein